MSAPKRPGAPRPSASRGTANDAARRPGAPVRKVTPGRAPTTPSAGVPKPARRSGQAPAKTRPGGPSGPGRTTPQAKPRIEAVGARGSLLGALSWRTGVLAIVVVLALAVLLPSLRVYFNQQENLRQLRAERDQAQQQVDDLTDDVARWDDPAYVVAQARERLAYVFPGETPYRVVDPELVQDAKEPASGAIKDVDTTAVKPWYNTLWDSIEVAGNGTDDGSAPTATPEPAP
ncbi:septum formation initiator family protein [Demequina sp.]|uniref:FtsB family cell division protein n=1 Tax=Demequina sp. TaxID=2050685 RepID=UPI003D0DA3A8